MCSSGVRYLTTLNLRRLGCCVLPETPSFSFGTSPPFHGEYQRQGLVSQKSSFLPGNPRRRQAGCNSRFQLNVNCSCNLGGYEPEQSCYGGTLIASQAAAFFLSARVAANSGWRLCICLTPVALGTGHKLCITDVF